MVCGANWPLCASRKIKNGPQIKILFTALIGRSAWGYDQVAVHFARLRGGVGLSGFPGAAPILTLSHYCGLLCGLLSLYLSTGICWNSDLSGEILYPNIVFWLSAFQYGYELECNIKTMASLWSRQGKQHCWPQRDVEMLVMPKEALKGTRIEWSNSLKCIYLSVDVDCNFCADRNLICEKVLGVKTRERSAAMIPQPVPLIPRSDFFFNERRCYNDLLANSFSKSDCYSIIL